MSTSATPDGLLPLDVAFLFAPHDTYTVLSVSATLMPFGTDAYIDAVDISFQVNGRPGVFVYTTPSLLFEQFAPFVGLEAVAGQIERIYQIAV